MTALNDAVKNLWDNKFIRWILIALFILLLYNLLSEQITELVKGQREKAARKQSVDDDNLRESKDAYKKFAAKLKEAMTGVNFSGRKILFEKLLSYNDDELKYTYNEFNKLVGEQDSLLSWIEDEWMISDTKDELVKRMIDLNFV